jgi:hypothetical protein
MNLWIYKVSWIFVVFLIWFFTFTPSEQVALGSAFLVLIGVIGEYIAEIKAVEARKWLEKRVKRLSMAILLLGLSGDALAIVMGQAEMRALVKQTGDAASNAQSALTDSGGALRKSGEATDALKKVDGRIVLLNSQLNSLSASASVLEQQEGDLRVDVEEKQLISAASESGHRFLPNMFKSLGERKYKLNVEKVVCMHEGNPSTLRYTTKLAGAISKLGWLRSRILETCTPFELSPATGVEIVSKWVEGPPLTEVLWSMPHPLESEIDNRNEVEFLTSGGRNVADQYRGQLMTLALSLHAAFRKDPTLDENTVRIVVGNGELSAR